jgi:RNA polymerase sigma-70 factor (ECF subfamily)
MEDELIRQAQSGNTVAFCRLAEQYERRIYSLALHYCHSAHDAEDLSQEAWLKAFQAVRTFRGESSFYTWLRRITINCFLNYQRARSFRNHLLTDLEGPETTSSAFLESSNLETILQNKILVSRVMQALSEVTPHQRLIFLLKHHEGMTCEEIARELRCSTGTVKKSLNRTVSKLRTQFDNQSETRDYVPCTAGQY